MDMKLQQFWFLPRFSFCWTALGVIQSLWKLWWCWNLCIRIVHTPVGSILLLSGHMPIPDSESYQTTLTFLLARFLAWFLIMFISEISLGCQGSLDYKILYKLESKKNRWCEKNTDFFWWKMEPFSYANVHLNRHRTTDTDNDNRQPTTGQPTNRNRNRNLQPTTDNRQPLLSTSFRFSIFLISQIHWLIFEVLFHSFCCQPNTWSPSIKKSYRELRWLAWRKLFKRPWNNIWFSCQWIVGCIENSRLTGSKSSLSSASRFSLHLTRLHFLFDLNHPWTWMRQDVFSALVAHFPDRRCSPIVFNRQTFIQKWSLFWRNSDQRNWCPNSHFASNIDLLMIANHRLIFPLHFFPTKDTSDLVRSSLPHFENRMIRHSFLSYRPRLQDSFQIWEKEEASLKQSYLTLITSMISISQASSRGIGTEVGLE